jgi:hypothetical protein
MGVIPMMVLLVLSALITSWISNYRAHRELRQRLETRPQAFWESKEATPDHPLAVPGERADLDERAAPDQGADIPTLPDTPGGSIG